MRRTLTAMLTCGLGVLMTSCSAGASVPVVPGSSVSITAPGKATVYVAVGASETVGAGADIDRFRNAWPSRFYVTALSRATVEYNLGIGGATVAKALTDELPQALAVHPTVVTVWLNVDDLVALVAPADYERDLGTLVHALRQGGTAKVLVANMPVIDHLPQVLACVRDGTVSELSAHCPIQFRLRRYSAVQLAEQETAYNEAVQRVVTREGAILVDLHAQGDVPVEHPDYVDREDGFHPSDQGHIAVAAAFTAALLRAGGE